MSLKGASTPLEFAQLLEDVRDGKADAPVRLYKYVERGVISYDEYIGFMENFGVATKVKLMKKVAEITKWLIIGVVVVILICTYIFNASAHSGRTDAYGGHWNRSTGTYHYHSGGVVSKNYNTGPAPNDRYDDGYDAGYNKGYGEGYESGRKNGYELGHKNGYKEGDEYKSPHDIALMIYSPISLIAILALCIKAFKK